ncbi:MAG: carboxypeptidase-like regulatory domain-containing protein, partial [Aquirufa sp.]
MKFIKLVLILLLFNQLAYGQKILQLIIKDENSRPLVNATIKLSWKNASLMQISDQNGVAIFQSLPDSTINVEISHVGYQAFQQAVPLTKSINQLDISLNPSQEELEEVVVSSTRSSRTIHDIPTRIEFIGGEEINEKSNMKSGDIRMLLSESTGIQV